MATTCKNLTIGLQAGTTRTFYASWTLSPASSSKRLDYYDVRWRWSDANGVWYNGSQSQVKKTELPPTWTAPDNAYNISCTAKPVSTTYEKEVAEYNKKGKKTGTKKVTKSYWSGAFVTVSKYIGDGLVPPKLSAPTVTIDGFRLIAEVITTASPLTAVEFRVVKNDRYIYATGISHLILTTGYASYSCDVTAGGHYKVQVRAYNRPRNMYGEWSDYSPNVETVPTAPTRFTKHTVLSGTSVQLYWNEVATAKTYDIEYAIDKSYFDVSSDVQSVSTETAVTSRIINNLESGRTWYFRLRASNSVGKSGWSEIYSIILGKIPAAPTTWSSTTSIVVGETVDLYWMHNSEDSSSQSAAQLEITVGSETKTLTLTGDDISSDPEVASVYVLNPITFEAEMLTDSADSEVLDSDGNPIQTLEHIPYPEGTTVVWRVRTKGILSSPNSGYGEWSTIRTVIIHAKPSIELTVSADESYNSTISVLNSFPLCIRGIAVPARQKAVGWNVKIVSNESYTTEDEIGRPKSVIAGSEVYSGFFVTETNTLNCVLSAGDLSLESDTSYTINVSVALDSGLTAENSHQITVSWDEDMYEPDAEVAIDFSNLSAYVAPFCVDDSEEGNLIPDVVLSVYRREYDGRFKLIASEIQNDRSVTVTDPHPALDFARYRIVARSTRTGQIGFSDLPGVPIGETGIVLQWDEEWQNFNTTDDIADLAENPRNGSTLILPYNISISDKYGVDVTLAEYIGRAHPVSYYGTQLGVSGSWSSSVPATDADTRFALRRLAIYTGDVYVREPSGVGYWANVNVSFSKSYDNLLSPISLDVTRVEGGV